MFVLPSIITLVMLAVGVLVIASIAATIIKSVYPTKHLSIEEKQHKERIAADMLKHIYFYLILFVTLMMSIGGSIGIFMGVANYVAPDYYAETYDQYKRNQCDMNHIIPYGATEDAETRTTEESPDMSIQPYPKDVCYESELRERYDRMIQDLESDTKRHAVKTMIQSLGWILIPLPVFLYFQRQLSNSKKRDAE